MVSLDRAVAGRSPHAYERDLVAVEDLYQLGEVHERAAKPVDLVDDHDVDASGLDVREQSLERGTFQRRTPDGGQNAAKRFLALTLLVRTLPPKRPA